jgi:5-methyltetrahydrofolate--homocysteine methyltransferase
MKRAVAYLEPFMLAEKEETGVQHARGKLVLATVKGDVHDIGKTIVGVVLGCNNYEVHDLGVMVPAERILDTAIELGADAVGLSGLITPSLDEMVDVAKEMTRRGFTIPLLIGGATTSKQHTAVRIAPAYAGSTVHVLDASRVIGVVSDLFDADRRVVFDRDNRVLQDKLRTQHASAQRELLSLEAARESRWRLDFDDLAKPPFTGVRTVEPDLKTLREYIDWTFFFHAWELKGKFPAILESPSQGAAARELFSHAEELLDEIQSKHWLQARGVYGYWPARTEGDDIVLESGVRFPMLRQQVDHGDEKPYLSLADFVAPDGDHVGAFAVTAGLGVDELAGRFSAEHDDYHAIMVKALADRLAEAFAEYLHEKVRREWYETGQPLSKDELIREKYRGIRPAFGYPACPDHTEKGTLFDLLGARSIGMELTDSFAMTPTAAVSGLYFAHRKSRYFMVGKIGRDQVADYARRKGMTVAEAERWLRPNLGYEEA